MFAVKAGGVHGWEIDIPTYNIFMRVRCFNQLFRHQINALLGSLCRLCHLHCRRQLRQNLSPHLLLPLIAAKMVQNCKLDDTGNYLGLYHWYLLLSDLRLRPN